MITNRSPAIAEQTINVQSHDDSKGIQMTDFVSLTCPSCGGRLKITNDIERFACAYCGSEHIVKRGEGVISLSPVVEGLDKIRSGVDKTASELAIVRLQREIAELEPRVNEALTIRSSLLQQMRAIWIEEIRLLRDGLCQLMKAEHHSPTASSWSTILGETYSDIDYCKRFERLTAEDAQFLVRVCQKGWFNSTNKQNLVNKLRGLQTGIPLIEKLESLQQELATHQQIVRT